MSKFELKLPKMGESVAEATITAWLKEVGDRIELDEPILEIATDKVDSEVPSEVEGTLLEKRFEVDDIVGVGQVLAVIEIEGEAAATTAEEAIEEPSAEVEETPPVEVVEIEQQVAAVQQEVAAPTSTSERFYSPLVRNIAKKEGISQSELDTVPGSGKEGRVTKNDILAYLGNRGAGVQAPATSVEPAQTNGSEIAAAAMPTVVPSGEDEIIEMTRMGKLIAKHMMDSIQTSAHVQSFIEADVTKIWNWRNQVKEGFKQREGENLTFTPIFMEAVAKALREFPMLNISVEGDKIIVKKNINLGMATALADGNLIVPVIKNADQLNLVGMAKQVNDLALRARTGKLNPDDIQDGTYTVTNVGTFGSIMGTPIINQPQVGILAMGAIRKVPAVIETNEGDFIGIRYKMFMSHSYDHRVVNGAMGGQFVKAVKDYLEAWDPNREI
ncbi:MAG: 2-oxo acid dehydrogenase subunit E2 [Bacteroidia bacterium]|nr:2-oxo acid dehydrogenase subunit E2 [Bacteroidia bacterium]